MNASYTKASMQNSTLMAFNYKLIPLAKVLLTHNGNYAINHVLSLKKKAKELICHKKNKKTEPSTLLPLVNLDLDIFLSYILSLSCVFFLHILFCHCLPDCLRANFFPSPIHTLSLPQFHLALLLFITKFYFTPSLPHT